MVQETGGTGRSTSTFESDSENAVFVGGLPLSLKTLDFKQTSALSRLLDRMSGCQFASFLVNDLPDCDKNQGRDRAVSSIRCLNVFYGFSCETFASAVYFLDCFLSKVKVQLKYLSCVATACFYIAAKVHQESEELPSVSELCLMHRQTWKPSDLKRMEMVILEKLEWATWPVTCPAVIKLVCDILSETKLLPQIVSGLSMLDLLFCKFETCINYKTCAIYKPTTLALCLVQHELRSMNIKTPAVHRILLHMHCILNVYDSEFHDCYNTVVHILDNYTQNPKSHPVCLSLPKPQPRMSLVSRPSYYGCTDLPTIEETDAHHYTSREHSEEDSDEEVFYSCIQKADSWSYCIVPDRVSLCKI